MEGTYLKLGEGDLLSCFLLVCNEVLILPSKGEQMFQPQTFVFPIGKPAPSAYWREEWSRGGTLGFLVERTI